MGEGCLATRRAALRTSHRRSASASPARYQKWNGSVRRPAARGAGVPSPLTLASVVRTDPGWVGDRPVVVVPGVAGLVGARAGGAVEAVVPSALHRLVVADRVAA